MEEGERGGEGVREGWEEGRGRREGGGEGGREGVEEGGGRREGGERRVGGTVG